MQTLDLKNTSFPLPIMAVWLGEILLNFEKQSQKVYLFKINVFN